jgi:hypothetical protein
MTYAMFLLLTSLLCANDRVQPWASPRESVVVVMVVVVVVVVVVISCAILESNVRGHSLAFAV